MLSALVLPLVLIYSKCFRTLSVWYYHELVLTAELCNVMQQMFDFPASSDSELYIERVQLAIEMYDKNSLFWIMVAVKSKRTKYTIIYELLFFSSCYKVQGILLAVFKTYKKLQNIFWVRVRLVQVGLVVCTSHNDLVQLYMVVSIHNRLTASIKSIISCLISSSVRLLFLFKQTSSSLGIFLENSERIKQS